MPDWVVLLLFVFVPAAGAICAHGLLRRFINREKLIPHHDVAGFLVAIVGVLYAVVLGFMVVTVWANFDSIQRTADVEAGYVGDVYGMAHMLREPQGAAIRRLMAHYAIEVRDVEWKTLETGQQDPQARAYLLQALVAVAQTPPPRDSSFATALRDEMASNQILTTLRDIGDNRRLRLIEAASHLPTALYLALIIGGMMVLGFVFLFGVDSWPLQMTMTGIVAGCIGLLFGLVVEFNAPYSGGIRISPAAWTYIIDNNHLKSAISQP